MSRSLLLQVWGCRTYSGLRFSPRRRITWSQLSPSDPYSHYRNFRSSCFERLFEEEDIARYEREMEMPGGGGVDLLREDEEAEDEEWEAYRRGGPYPFLR